MNQKSNSITTSDGMWDVIMGIRSWRLWAFMGVVDIRQRYRRSLLGPLWIALGLGVTVIGLGLLYSQVFNSTDDEYVPFVAISLLIWQFVTSVLIESTTIFAVSSALISSVRLPYTSLILRSITRNVIVAAHGVIVVVAAFVFYGTPVSPLAVVAVLGVALICLNLYWMALLIALLSARFRDVAQIFNYLIGLMLFLTPVIWMPEQVRPGSPYLLLNPFAHLIAVVREPILNGVFPTQSFLICAIMALVGLPVAAFVFARTRRYVAYWT